MSSFFIYTPIRNCPGYLVILSRTPPFEDPPGVVVGL